MPWRSSARVTLAPLSPGPGGTSVRQKTARVSSSVAGFSTAYSRAATGAARCPSWEATKSPMLTGARPNKGVSTSATAFSSLLRRDAGGTGRRIRSFLVLGTTTSAFRIQSLKPFS